MTKKKPLPNETKCSIPSIILRDLARDFRKEFAEFRVEAHPITENSCRMVFVIEQNKNSITFNLYSFGGDTFKIETTNWVVDGDSHAYVPTEPKDSNNLYELSHDSSTRVCIADPGSIEDLRQWMLKRILAMIAYVDYINSNRSTKT